LERVGEYVIPPLLTVAIQEHTSCWSPFLPGSQWYSARYQTWAYCSGHRIHRIPRIWSVHPPTLDYFVVILLTYFPLLQLPLPPQGQGNNPAVQQQQQFQGQRS